MSRVAVMDLGGQYCHLIARKVREHGVYSEIVNSEISINELKGFDAIIVSGGPSSVYDPESPKISPDVFRLGIPILGICYGHQLMTILLGGKVRRGEVKEYGTSTLRKVRENSLFRGLSKKEKVWMSHGDTVYRMPEGFTLLGSTGACKIAAMGNFSERLYGVQFHPEVYHTSCGTKIFRSFLFDIAKCKVSWDPEDSVRYRLDEIRRKVNGKNVFFLVSGGVDSTVAFSLCVKALGEDRVYGLTVDTGLLRKNESRNIRKMFTDLGVKNFKIVDAKRQFIKALEGVYDPEQKRKVIGEKFMEVQAKAFDNLKLPSKHWILGQGTIYPDTIESGGTSKSEIIKTHHNRVLGVQKFLKTGRLIEPISDLYKDEVRSIGDELGLPKHIVWAYPFPGPGLAIRCLCSDGSRPLEQSDIVNRLVAKHGFQSAVLPIRSVGVQGDGRTYSKTCLLYGESDMADLEKISALITNNVSDVNRVAYLPKSAGISIRDGRIEKAELTPGRLRLLREADSVVSQFVEEKAILHEIWQFPVILIPLSFGRGETIVLRPVCSTDGMTAEFYKIDGNLLNQLTERIRRLRGVDAVLYDATNKPPATIEWE